MKRSYLFLLALSLFVFCVCRPLSAGVISVEYPADRTGWPHPGFTGKLEIQFDTEPQNRTFAEGGIGLALTLSTPGVIEFTGARVINDGRWALAGADNVTANSTGTLYGWSVFTPGLPRGRNVVYAVVDYKVVGRGGTRIDVGVSGEDPLFDASVGFGGADVSNEFTFQSLFFDNRPLPEPGSIVLATIGIAAVALRCRNG